MFDSEFAKTEYIEKDNAVLHVWKKEAHFDDYRNPVSASLDMLRKHKGKIAFLRFYAGIPRGIISEYLDTYPDKKIYALIGGFHLFTKPASEIRDIARVLDSMDIDLICTGHCTNERAYGIMKKRTRRQANSNERRSQH